MSNTHVAFRCEMSKKHQ